MADAASPPVGFRLHNPGNLELGSGSILYVGEVRPSSHSPYREFEDDPHGFRALALDILAAQKVHGCTNIQEFISGKPGYYGFAPPADGNPSDVYAQMVARECGVGPLESIVFQDHLFALLDAVSHFEQGVHYDPAVIDQGISLIHLES